MSDIILNKTKKELEAVLLQKQTLYNDTKSIMEKTVYIPYMNMSLMFETEQELIDYFDRMKESALADYRSNTERIEIMERYNTEPMLSSLKNEITVLNKQIIGIK